jgi:hypothetical protein
MKSIVKAFLNDTLVIVFSFLLYSIGVLYSNDPGFYSRELLSSGGDDFLFFIGTTHINIIGIIFGLMSLIINIILLRLKNKILNVSHIFYKMIFIIQLLNLVL